MTPKEAFEVIPFNDDADEPQTWRGIALSAISDMYHYAEDADPARRYVSANAYAEDAQGNAVREGFTLVPNAALEWLFGSGPDADGKWFGEREDEAIAMLRKQTPRYWW